MEAMSHQGVTSDQVGPKLTASMIGKESGVSGTQVKRYIRLTELIPELLDMLDNKKLKLNKIAARWPAKAVAQFFTFSKKGSDRIVPR